MSDERELKLPRLIGSRPAAHALADELGYVRGHDVHINARSLRSASPSAVDEFVKSILVEGGAATLRVSGAGRDFLEDIEKSASDRQVSDRLRTPSFN